MAADLTLLTTRAECDKVLATLAARLDILEHRDAGIDFADRQATRTQTAVAGRITGLTASIASYEATLAGTTILPDERERIEALLDTAQYNKRQLERRAAGATGAAAYLSDVDADVVDANVTLVTAAQTAVTAHKNTLPA